MFVGRLNLQPPGNVVGEDLGEWLGQFGADDLVVVDEQLLEEGLVGLAPDLGWGLPVHPLAVGAELEGIAEGALDLIEAQLGCSEPLLGLLDLSRDPLLLVLEEFHRNGSRVMRPQQRALLVLEPGEPSPLSP